MNEELAGARLAQERVPVVRVVGVLGAARREGWA